MHQDTTSAFIEDRRSYQRLQCEYSAIVQGYNEDGRKFEEIVTVENLSASGAYFLINRNLKLEQIVTLRIAFPTGSLRYGSSKVTINAVVVRVDHCSDKVLGIASHFQNFRFL